MLVWNDAETARRIRVSITNRSTEASVLQRTYRIEADAFVEIEMTKPGAYSLDVGLDGDEPETIDFPVDTCNSVRTTVAVRPNGAVDWEQLSTMVGCATTLGTTTRN